MKRDLVVLGQVCDSGGSRDQKRRPENAGLSCIHGSKTPLKSPLVQGGTNKVVLMGSGKQHQSSLL